MRAFPHDLRFSRRCPTPGVCSMMHFGGHCPGGPVGMNCFQVFTGTRGVRSCTGCGGKDQTLGVSDKVGNRPRVQAKWGCTEGVEDGTDGVGKNKRCLTGLKKQKHSDVSHPRLGSNRVVGVSGSGYYVARVVMARGGREARHVAYVGSASRGCGDVGR
jgi:hypothetical protein